MNRGSIERRLAALEEAASPAVSTWADLVVAVEEGRHDGIVYTQRRRRGRTRLAGRAVFCFCRILQKHLLRSTPAPLLQENGRRGLHRSP